MSQRDREFDSKQQPNRILTVKWAYKWEVFRRLKALEIPCQCSTNEPLLVQLDSPQAAVQFWSVVRQVNSSRHELISCLDRCWQINCDRKDR